MKIQLQLRVATLIRIKIVQMYLSAWVSCFYVVVGFGPGWVQPLFSWLYVGHAKAHLKRRIYPVQPMLNVQMAWHALIISAGPRDHANQMTNAAQYRYVSRENVGRRQPMTVKILDAYPIKSASMITV